ncbi:MAG: HAMP domain-containing histidine kinase [Halioglobus sp.]|nr:HAMP domain-containing histidine kinase [Halioglobus sp.]
MQARDVFSSLTFRYIAQYILALSAAVFMLLGGFYLYLSYNAVSELGTLVMEEGETLQLVYRGQDMAGVTQYIEDQSAAPALQRFYYLVTDASGDKIAGNLTEQPNYREFDEGWFGFEMALPSLGKPLDVDFLARPVELGDGNSAIVATDYVDLADRIELVFQALVRMMAITIILGMSGGFFVAWRALNQVERLNRDISLIVRGDPSRRLNLDPDEGFIHTLAIAVNQMLEQMESLMQGVRRVSDNIAHDLRTPLTRMRNDLSQLRGKVEGAQRGQLDGIIEECDELLSSFNALLRISALEAGSRLAGGTQVDLNALLKDVFELYEPLALERNIAFELDASGQHVCTGEADLLFQVFANLLDNALKYTPDGGQVAVRLRFSAANDGEEEGHYIVVADSGPGIPAKERMNVFRRFYRVESSRTEQPGNGLGLSLVQAIVRYHHGTIELGSNNPGLQVRIRLP